MCRDSVSCSRSVQVVSVCCRQITTVTALLITLMFYQRVQADGIRDVTDCVPAAVADVNTT